jgi:hypothetical protein
MSINLWAINEKRARIGLDPIENLEVIMLDDVHFSPGWPFAKSDSDFSPEAEVETKKEQGNFRLIEVGEE